MNRPGQQQEALLNNVAVNVVLLLGLRGPEFAPYSQALEEDRLRAFPNQRAPGPTIERVISDPKYGETMAS